MDLVKHEQALKFTLIRDPSTSVTAISNTHALTYILFTEHSPLTQGLQELFDIFMAGFHNQHLCMVGMAQPDWILHVLWAIYEKCYDFFQMKLSEEDLLEGAMLINPLTVLNGHISEFEKLSNQAAQEVYWCHLPPSNWHPCSKTTEGMSHKNGKQKGQGGGGTPVAIRK